MIILLESLPRGTSKEAFMTKKFVIIAGIIALAAMAAAAVAYILVQSKGISECLDCEEDDEI